MTIYSSLLERAYRIASVAHHGQTRKISNVPYIVHPCAVAALLAREGFSDDVLATAVLHDVIEDTDVTLDDLAQQFPPHVIEWVDAVSEEKETVAGEKIKWTVRKRHHVEAVRKAAIEARAVVLADKLHNLSSIQYDLNLGEDVWSQFHSSKAVSLQYYTEMLQAADQGEPELQKLAIACKEVLAALQS